jgi:hypothetical protein
MTSQLKDLCANYEKLLANYDDVPHSCNEKQSLELKIQLIDRMITDVNIAVEDLNFDVLQHKITLNEQDKKDYDDMVIATNTIKAFSPYIMWFNVYQKLINEKISKN